MGFMGIDIKKISGFIFYSTLFFFIVAVSIKHNAVDFDLWSRLIMGEYVFNNFHPMFNDVVSYIKTHTWYDPEWISSGFIFFIKKHFSMTGLTFLKAIAHFLILYVISKAILVRNVQIDSKKLGFYVLLVAAFIQCSTIVFTVRCQVLTFILIGVWILLLEKIRLGENKYLYLLPIIMLFWLNSHGGCIAGIGILLLYGIGEFLNKADYKKYFVVLFFVCLVFLINPWGIDYIKFIFDSSFLDRSWISEWNSSFNNPKGNIIYKLLMLTTFLAYIYNIYKNKITYQVLDKTKLLVIFVIAFLSAKYVKHTCLLLVIYSIYMYEDFFLIYNSFMDKLRKYLEIDKIIAQYLIKFKNIALYIAIYIYSLVIFVTCPIKDSYSKASFEHYPIHAMEFLQTNQIKGNILAPFYISGYLAYKLYPDNKIYMDGRQEQVYTLDDFDNSMFFFGQLGKNYNQVLKNNSPDIILFEKPWRISDELLESKDYQLVYSDSLFYLFVRKELVQFKFKSIVKDNRYYIKTLFNKKYEFK